MTLKKINILAFVVVLFSFASVAHADLVYTRTPSVPSVDGTLHVRIQGVFGTDFCNSQSTAYYIRIFGDHSYFEDNSSSPVKRFHDLGEQVDDTVDFPLPVGSYSFVQLICFSTVPQGGTIIDGGFQVVTLTIDPVRHREAIMGESYNLQFSGRGGTAPYTWNIVSGTLPEGLTLNSFTGLVSGTTTVTGSFPINVQITDAVGATKTKEYTLQSFERTSPPLTYTRTPNTSTVSGVVHIRIQGIFGADMCANTSDSYYIRIVSHNSLAYFEGGTFSPVRRYHSLDEAVDDTLDFPIPPGTYGPVQLICLGTEAEGGIAIESGFEITTNNPPILNAIGNKTVNEGQTLAFTLSATDPDGDALTYSAANLPPGSTFSTSTATFSWTPTYAQAGNYPNVEFTVTDGGSPMMLDFEDITITVGDVNRAPVIVSPGSQQVLEHSALTFTIDATDPDGDAVTLSAIGMPSGATFNPSTGVFSWTPGNPTAGVYTPAFIATDNGSSVASSSVDVVITVGSNPTPTEQSQNMIDTVVALPLPANVENSYLANLNKVGPFIEQGKIQQAINQINAFINKVNQDYSHGDITQAEHDSLISYANALIASLQ